LVAPGLPPARSAGVKDGAGFFSRATMDEVSAAIKDIKNFYQKDILVETFPGVPAKDVKRFRALNATGRSKYFSKWAIRRARAARVEGVYVLVCKKPGHLEVTVRDATTKKGFPATDRIKLRDMLLARFKQKKFDQGLTEGVQFVHSRFAANLLVRLPAVVLNEVRDPGGFFTKAAVEKANREIKEFKQRFGRDLVVESFKTVPPDRVKEVAGLDAAGRYRFFAAWVRARSLASRGDGIHVLICRKPAHIRVGVGDATLKKAFTPADRDQLVRLMVGHLRERQYDRALDEMLGFVSDTVSRNLSPAVQVAADSKAALARKAKAILQTNCYPCHGKNGANEGSFNFVLDRGQLIDRKKVIPGDPRRSRLFKKVSLDEMPPDSVKSPRPSEKDIAVLKQWIEAGAPDFNPPAEKRAIISLADQLRSMKEDLDRLPPRKRRAARYFTITHLYNAGLNEDQLQSYRHGLSKLVNSLSWGRDIVPPRPVDPARTIFRIDLDDYEWNDKVWDKIVAAYPYGVIYDTASAKACSTATQSRLPHVRGDWFVFAASRPPLYHEVLQLPATDRELEKELKVNVAENIRRERVARAGFNGSGVSHNNRLIERHKAGNGAYWKSYDFSNNTDQRNLFAHPLGPAGPNAFKHDGGEIIFNLPNGLQAYLLVDGKGNRIDEGPTNIVSTRKRPPTVINGISCMGCHGKGMIEKDDQVREHVLKSSTGFTNAEKESVLALYHARNEFRALLQRDADRFRKAVEKTGAPLTATEPVAALADRFGAEIDLKGAAAEVGVGINEFVTRFRSPRLARDLGPFKVDGGTIKRQVFEGAFPEVVRELQLGRFLKPTARPKASG
jgi:uncharacterized membrane protein YgcG